MFLNVKKYDVRRNAKSIVKRLYKESYLRKISFQKRLTHITYRTRLF